MNELEEILGIKFPSNCEVSSVTNTSKKVKKDICLMLHQIYIIS